jgi:hypothetical protein
MNRSTVNQDSREYINEIRHNGSLSDDLINRLDIYIRGNTILRNENDAYNRAKYLFTSFSENATDREKISRLNDMLDGMAAHLVGIREETEPHQQIIIDQVVNDIYALDGNNNVNEQNNIPYNSQGGKRRRGKKSKRKSRKIRRKRTRRYRR